MKRLLLPTLCLLFNSLFAQYPSAEKFSLTWTSGSIYFKSGDTLDCQLRFNQVGGHHVLQVNDNGLIATLQIKDVQQFSFFDSVKNKQRTFGAFKRPNIFEQEYFMELIYGNGHFSILNHKTMEVPDELNFSRFIGKPVKTHKKYICHESTGMLLPLSRENLLELVAPNREKVLAFVKDHGIRFRRIADFIQVFEYHNSL